MEPGPARETTNRTASQVIADHIRAATFMIYDGVVPSNEGRGYVLRKIIRRALRFGRKLGIEGRFFADLSPSVFQAMGDAYPELEDELSRIMKALAREEGQFSLTLGAGLQANWRPWTPPPAPCPGARSSSSTTPSASRWTWWRTGAGSAALTCDLAGFQAELAEQKAKSRSAMKVHDIRLGGDLAALADMRGHGLPGLRGHRSPGQGGGPVRPGPEAGQGARRERASCCWTTPPSTPRAAARWGTPAPSGPRA